MNPQHKLKIASREEPKVTRADIELARMAQSWREWIGINGKSWKPFSEPNQRPTLPVDEILSKSGLCIIVDSPALKWRSVLKWLGWMR